MAAVQTRIGPLDQGRAMTLEEFRDAEEEPGYRYELARGVVEVTQVPRYGHWRVVDNIHEALSTYRRRFRGVIDMIGHGSEVRLIIASTGSDRNPDLAVAFVGSRRDDLGRPVPDLAIEVVSPGANARHRDYVDKRNEYRDLGLREYWIVDPSLLQVTVLVRTPESDWNEATFQGEDRIDSPSLPGLELTVDALWIDADLGVEEGD